MSVESVYQDMESILQRIDSIKRRFGTYRHYQFEQTLRETMEEPDPSELEQTHSVKMEKPEPLQAEEQSSQPYGQIIDAAAKHYRIPPALIRAVIKQESNFDAEAVSHKGAMGLMQLMPATADLLGVEDPFNPQENISGGTRYLGDLIDLYGGNLNKALAAYNAGPQKVTNGVPNIRETRNFVDSVLHYYEAFTKTADEEEF
jgi:soluble lytic murein transglycosylase-like protein